MVDNDAAWPLKKPVDHLYAAGIFCEYIRNMGLNTYSIVSPDEGFAKNARYYSNTLGVPLVIGNKQRRGHDEKADILSVIGDIAGRDAVIVDDFTITCGTLVEMAKVLKANGAGDIYAFVSHGLLSRKSLQTLEPSPIKKLVMTDTVYNPEADGCGSVEVLSASELFAKAIKIIHERESLSTLF